MVVWRRLSKIQLSGSILMSEKCINWKLYVATEGLCAYEQYFRYLKWLQVKSSDSGNRTKYGVDKLDALTAVFLLMFIFS